MRHWSVLAVLVAASAALGLGGCSSATSETPSSGPSLPGSGETSGPGGPISYGGGSTSQDPGLYPGAGGSSFGAPTAGTSSGPGAAPVVDGAGVGGSQNENQGDNYAAVGTNPFVLAAHDPLSTFAADVDTASYDIFRRDVNQGTLPVPASVRLEEYVNFFSYDYPAPTAIDEHPFRISLAAAPHLLSRGSHLLRVGIQSTLPVAEQKKPANLVFLVDASGSMAASNKLPLVQYTITQALDLLAPTDTVSLVAYASNAGLRLAPTPVSERQAIESAIASLAAGGSTNGAGGIQLAYEQAEAGFIPGGINHVLLCTDGDFNVGVSGTEALVDLIVEKRRTGITLTVLGYGSGNLNDAMMEAVSNKGNGVYGVIADEDQATTYVYERLLSSLQLVAKDMKIQVEFNADLVHAYRLLGYENRDIADDDFRNDGIDAGEVGAGHRVTALYEIVPAGGTIPEPAVGEALIQDGEAFAGEREVSPGDWVLVKVRYKDVDAVESDPAYEVSASMTPDEAAPSFVSAGLDLQWSIAMAAFAEILKQSPYANPGHLEIIGNIARAQAERDPDRAEFSVLFDTARDRLQ